MKISKAELVKLSACGDGLRRFIKQTNGSEESIEVADLVGGENTCGDLLWLAGKKLPEERIVRFACDCALINIEKIKPYTDKYDLIVGFLTNPTARTADDAAHAARTAADAAYATDATYAADAYAADANYAADAYAADAYAAAHAARTTAAAAYADAYAARAAVAANHAADARAAAARAVAANHAADAAADAAAYDNTKVNELLRELFA